MMETATVKYIVDRTFYSVDPVILAVQVNARTRDLDFRW